MAKYKLIVTFSDGEVIDSYEEYGDDGVFDSEEEAEEYYYNMMSDYDAGGRILNLSNPGDYPLDEDEEDQDYEIVEI